MSDVILGIHFRVKVLIFQEFEFLENLVDIESIDLESI